MYVLVGKVGKRIIAHNKEPLRPDSIAPRLADVCTVSSGPSVGVEFSSSTGTGVNRRFAASVSFVAAPFIALHGAFAPLPGSGSGGKFNSMKVLC